MKRNPTSGLSQESDSAHVDWNVFAKMYAKDYSTQAFYFVQTSPSGKVRIACWCPDPHASWDIAEQVVTEYPRTVEVLLKTETEEPSEDDPWERYHGADLDKEKVLAAVHKYEDYVLGDASNEIAIRRSDTEEYVAYDSAGVLWLYPADDGKRWCDLLEGRGFRLEYRTLISGVFHWNRSADQAERQRDSLVLDLGLVPVEKAYS